MLDTCIYVFIIPNCEMARNMEDTKKQTPTLNYQKNCACPRDMNYILHLMQNYFGRTIISFFI